MPEEQRHVMWGEVEGTKKVSNLVKKSFFDSFLPALHWQPGRKGDGRVV